MFSGIHLFQQTEDFYKKVLIDEKEWQVHLVFLCCVGDITIQSLISDSGL